MSEREKPHVWIVWGSCPDADNEASYYEFETEGEKQAFLLGVDESNGWLSWAEVTGPTWHQTEDGEVVDGPPEENEDDDG